MTRAPLVALVVALLAPGSASALDWPGHAEAVQSAFDRGRTVEQRTEALRRASLLDATAGAAVLADGLGDAEPEVRVEAAMLAGDLGVVSLQSLLTGRLADRQADVRAAAATALGKLGSYDSVAPVSRLLADSNVPVRVAAVEALGMLGSAEAVIALSGVLRDRSTDVVVAAIYSLGRLGQPGSVYAILEKANDPSEAVSLAAIEALVAMRAGEAEGALVELVGAGRPAVALAAIEGLGALGAEGGVPVLVAEAVSPRLSGGRTAAVAALSEIASPVALGPLATLLHTAPSDVADYYEAMGVEAWPTLRREASRTNLNEQRGLLRVWLRSGDPAAVAALSGAGGEDTDELLRVSRTPDAVCTATERVAFEALDEAEAIHWVRWGVASDAAQCVEGAVRTRMWSHEGAMSLLTEFGTAAPELTAYVAERYLDMDAGGWEEWAGVVQTLGHVGAPAVGTLVRLLYAEDARVRRETAYVLAELGGVNASPELRSAVFEDATRDVSWIRLLRPAMAADAEARALARRLARSGTPAERAEAISLLADACGAESDALTRAAASEDFWLRRAAATYALACPASVAVAGADPVAERSAYGTLEVDALVAIARDTSRGTYVRVAALAALGERAPETAQPLALTLFGDRDDWVRSAAWLLVGTAGPLSPTERAFRALASTSRVERAALYATLSAPSESQGEAGAQEEPHSVQLREDDPQALRVLDGSAPHSAPVVVFAIDENSGAARQDEPVFALLRGGGFDVGRTDREGRVVWNRDDIIAVFVGRSAP